MDKFEERYGIVEDENTEEYHRSRRMYCIHNDQLIIAKPNLPYSHAVWFNKEGLISREDDRLMNEMVRGIVDSQGDVYFYVAYDFQVNERAESTFFCHLPDLVSRLSLRLDRNVFGGLSRDNDGNLWVPRKEFGNIRENFV